MMVWQPRPKKWPLDEYLTAEEAAELRDYEQARKDLAARAPRVSLIRNRAIQRARYAARQA